LENLNPTTIVRSMVVGFRLFILNVLLSYYLIGKILSFITTFSKALMLYLSSRFKPLCACFGHV